MSIAELFERNRAWAAGRTAGDPDFFKRLTEIQRPLYLWIGCADSRVPANEIVGLAPGEMFVHRNVANIVSPGDPNGMAVVQYAVEVLDVRQIMIVGHYGCGGVRAVLEGSLAQTRGHVERWLAPLQFLASSRQAELSALESFDERFRRLCEINVAEQVRQLLRSDVLMNARHREVEITVYGLIYDLRDGLLRDLDVTGTNSLS